MIDKITFSIFSDPKNIGKVRELICQSCRSYSLTPTEVNKIVLAIDEACTNVIKHSYDGDFTRKIDISMIMFKDKMMVKIRDYGKKFDINTVKERNLSEIRIGGLGVFFIKSIMDEVNCNLSFDNGTELVLVKKF